MSSPRERVMVWAIVVILALLVLVLYLLGSALAEWGRLT